MPIKPDISHTRALELFNDKQLDQALAMYKQLITLNKEDAQAWHMAGAIAGMIGDNTAARSYIEQAISLSPQSHGPHQNLAAILQASGDLQGAMQQFKRALELKPDDPQILTSIASLHARFGEFGLAESSLQSVIRNSPSYYEAYNALGNVYRETLRPDAAISCFREAIRICPDYLDALCNLGAVLTEQLEFEEADSCYVTALRYYPGNPAALHGQGNLYQSKGEYEKAKASYQQALTNNPSDSVLLSSLASLYERCGEEASASQLLAPLIDSRQFNPDAAITFANLCMKDGQYDTAIQVLEESLRTHKSPGKIIDIYFSLGELYDRLGDFDEAFSYFRKANDLDASTTPAQDYSSLIKVVTEFYTKLVWPKLPRSTIQSELPIFIVGMPRTGTSLIEQILASHQQVCPGGERSDIFTIIDSLISIPELNWSFPGSLETMTTDFLDKLSTDYLASIESQSKQYIRFTDKTPLHGILLGFINQLLPRSRVIVCNRDPMDTCLSIYFHRFNAFHGYARHMDTLGTFFRHYYSLMEHWINILDIDILQIQYEEFVRHPEVNIRRLIEFSGLDWDKNCLSFYKNKRTITTPSYNQVRQPIYTSSIERWKNYDKHLEPLRMALRQNEGMIDGHA